MATTKKLNSSDLEEFLQTDAGKEALSTYCFEKGFLSKKKQNTLFSEIKIPKGASIFISLTTLSPFEEIIRKDEELRLKINKTPKGKISELRVFLSMDTNENSFYDEVGERAYNCIRAAKLNKISELVQFLPEELLKFRNFGEISLRAVMKWLHKRGLCLGMDIEKFHLQE